MPNHRSRLDSFNDSCQVEAVGEHIATAKDKLTKLAAMGGPKLNAALEAMQAEITAQEAELDQQVGLRQFKFA